MGIETQLDSILQSLQSIKELTDSLEKQVDRLESQSAIHEQGVWSKYDFNLWVGEYDTLSVSAYRQRKTESGIETDTSKWVTFKVKLSDENTGLLGRLFQNTNWKSESWYEHDDWVSPEFIMEACVETIRDARYLPGDTQCGEKTADALFQWMATLPEYEMEVAE